MKSYRFFPADIWPFQNPVHEVFADDATSPIWISRRAIFQNSQSKNKTKLQFFYIRLKNMLNSLTEWGKMAKRSSNLKEKVLSLCGNIWVIINLTENSTASFDYCDESCRKTSMSTKVRFFCGGEVGTSQKFVTFWDKCLNIFYKAV